MNSEKMALERALLNKRLVAIGALVRPVSRMHGHMLTPVVLVSEAFVAVRTYVRLIGTAGTRVEVHAFGSPHNRRY